MEEPGITRIVKCHTIIIIELDVTFSTVKQYRDKTAVNVIT